MTTAVDIDVHDGFASNTLGTRYNEYMTASIRTSADQLVALLQTIKDKVSAGLTPADNSKISAGIVQMMGRPETLMGAIAIARLCPHNATPQALIQACQTHNPLLLDELFDFPGVNTLGLQHAVLESSSLPQAMGRFMQWYPDGQTPAEIQHVLVNKIYRKVIAEATGGPDHRQELSLESGQVLAHALDRVGTSFTDKDAVFLLLRGAHYVLRGMARQIELHHQLSDDFPEKALQAAWRFHRDHANAEVASNMAAFTLATKELYPDAIHGLTVSFPEASAMLLPVWDKEAKDVRAFLTEMGGKGKTIVSRNYADVGMTLD